MSEGNDTETVSESYRGRKRLMFRIELVFYVMVAGLIAAILLLEL